MSWRPFSVLSNAWAQTLNPYTYVKNNPLNLVDPSGEDWFSITMGVIGVGCTVAAGVAASPLVVAGALGVAAVAGGASIYATWDDRRHGRMSENQYKRDMAMGIAEFIPIGKTAGLARDVFNLGFDMGDSYMSARAANSIYSRTYNGGGGAAGGGSSLNASPSLDSGNGSTNRRRPRYERKSKWATS